MVERQPSKLNVASSSLVSRSKGFFEKFYLEVRPSSSGVERILGKDEVTGSNPVLGSIVILYKFIKRIKTNVEREI